MVAGIVRPLVPWHGGRWCKAGGGFGTVVCFYFAFPPTLQSQSIPAFFFNFQTALFLWEQAEFVAGLGTSKEQFDSWSAEAIKVRPLSS